ncbi:MAG TPA: DUF1801 domain-containing protein [Candidatus Eisenbacteria bacterium]|nr:DUF1801 domain-containing protein [Candidatus Eisenbacteria bacterium]
MAELKTKKTKASVTGFLERVKDERRRQDSFEVLALMKKITKEEPMMWGTSIVGFGDYRYKYASGREGDFFPIGFSPRKEALTLYFMSGFEPFPELMNRLGTYKTGKGCLYVKSLEDVHLPTLRKLIVASLAHLKKRAAS